MRRRVLKTFGVATVVAMMAVSALGAPSKDARSAKHKPPYKLGPSGGDEYNHVEADRESGTMTIFRVFPFPGSIGCIPESRAAWATFTVVHDIDRPVAWVTVNYEDVLLDGNTWMTLHVEDGDGEWLGFKARQGPVAAGSGALKVHIGDRSPSGGSIEVRFGLQVSSACPQVMGAHASFPSVAIDEE
ncbi:MAG: hypothetical protein ACRDJI_03770 [Actinomycetota bacterium]